MLEGKLTSKKYDSEYIKQQEKSLTFQNRYNTSKLAYTPFERLNYCSKATQNSGLDVMCSSDASYARSPNDVKGSSLEVKKSTKGPHTHYLTYDDTRQNRGQSNDRWFIETPKHWNKNPIQSAEDMVGVNTVQRAKDSFIQK